MRDGNRSARRRSTSVGGFMSRYCRSETPVYGGGCRGLARSLPPNLPLAAGELELRDGVRVWAEIALDR